VPFHLQQGLLDLRRKHVDAANNQHVVGAPGNPAHFDRGAAARTRAPVERGDIARAVADNRHGLLGERGKHQFAIFAVGHRFERVGLDTFDQKMVFLNVHAVAMKHSPLTPGPMTSLSP
jgi:hypothetical protein